MTNKRVFQSVGLNLSFLIENFCIKIRETWIITFTHAGYKFSTPKYTVSTANENNFFWAQKNRMVINSRLLN